MIFSNTAMDDLNRRATDYLECPKCDSENLELRGSECFLAEQSEKQYWRCEECGHDFVHYT